MALLLLRYIPSSLLVFILTVNNRKAIHAKCNLKVNCDKKIGLITKSDCMNVTDLNQTVRYICLEASLN